MVVIVQSRQLTLLLAQIWIQACAILPPLRLKCSSSQLHFEIEWLRQAQSADRGLRPPAVPSLADLGASPIGPDQLYVATVYYIEPDVA